MPPRAYLRLALIGAVVISGTVLAFRSTLAGSQSDDLPADARQAVQSGVQLERSRKWLDAIEHYEKTIKSWPDSRELEYGLRRAKIHFGIERRYSDTSFSKSLLTLSRAEALGLFDEILAKIQAQYVDPVSSTSFVAHGTESLYLALADDRFLQANVASRFRTGAGTLRRTLRDEYWNKPIGQLDSPRAVVTRICDLAETQVGVSAAPVVMEYIFGGCNALDDYSSYLTPSRLNDLYGNIEGQFVGLGIEMKAELGSGLLLVNVLPDSPAAEGGLFAGEHIVSIDGTDCRQMTTDEAAGRLQGLEGTQVAIEVQRSSTATVRRMTITRRAVTVKSIPVARMVDQEQGVGYIQLASFQKSSVQELDAALDQLRRQGMRALIWDVRGNPGGLLTAAVEVLDRFIPEGVLVSTRGRTLDQNYTYSAHRPRTWNLPLVLLTDGESASASEIVAGAIRDHKRGSIVGRKTYGKWSVQSIFPVRGSAGLRLTTAKFYSPHGHTLGKVGVHPDIEVPEPDKRRAFFRAPTDIDFAGDPDVQKALDVLRKQMASR